MSRRALVLAAHGSRLAPQVNQRVRDLAARLAESGDFQKVCAAFHQGAPAFSEVLDLIEATDVTVVPVMTSRGWYADHVLPRELARNSHFARKRVRVTAPLGAHARIAPLVERRIDAICRESGFEPRQASVVLVGHGTRRHAWSRRTTVDLASRLGYRGRFGQVFAVFLDDEPGLQAVAQRVVWPNVVVIPFLIGAGPHALQDIPNRLGSAPGGSRCRIICDRPVGDDDGLIDIIADLAVGRAEASVQRVPDRLVRLGTRASAMAMWQARHVAELLANRGTALALVPLTTLGDRRQNVPIHELPGDAPFCQEIEHALGSGLIDLAVHSLKDLSLRGSPELELAALLPRGDVREALITRQNLALHELPPGAIVGISSPRRAAQVRRLRPDLVLKPIRGPVDERIRLVRSGAFDATVLALVGLQRLGCADLATEVFSVEQFTPAPGQAALALQVRAGDGIARALARPLDDQATRIATTLELNVLRALDADERIAVAACATVGQVVRLFVRLVTTDGKAVHDIQRGDRNPGALLRAVLAEAQSVCAEWLQGAAV